MLLRDVDLRIRTRQRQCTAQTTRIATMKMKRVIRPRSGPSRPFTTACPLFVKGLRQHNGGAKVTRSSVFAGSGDREQQTLLAGCEITRLC